jgi:hypothetical protein
MFVWSPFIGTYQYRDAKSIFILDNSGRIEQGPIVQGRTLTGTHETGTRRHSTYGCCHPFLTKSIYCTVELGVLEMISCPLPLYLADEDGRTKQNDSAFRSK